MLTFHSGEDRRVKKAFQAGYRAGVYSDVATEVIRSAKEETFSNRRASAAKLRWAVRGDGDRLLMRCRRQAERLRLCILVGMKTRVDFAIADDDHGQHEAEEHGAHS